MVTAVQSKAQTKNISNEKPQQNTQSFLGQVKRASLVTGGALIFAGVGACVALTSSPVVFLVSGSLANAGYVPFCQNSFVRSFAFAAVSSFCVQSAKRALLSRLNHHHREETQGSSSASASKQPSAVVAITKENYKQEVLDSKIPVVLDAYATWCPPCKAIAPIFDDLSVNFQGKVKFAKFNIDEQPALAKELHVTSVPTFLCVQNGKEVHRQTGIASQSAEGFALGLIRHFV